MVAELPKRGLGIVLERERKERGHSRQDLAEVAGLSYPYVSELETGKKYPSERALANLAAALDLDPYVLEEMARTAEYDTAASNTTSPPIAPASSDDELVDRIVGSVLTQIEPIIREAVRSALREGR